MTNTPKPHRQYEFGTFNERLEHICALLEITAPEIVYEDGEPTMTDSLLDWIKESEINMDWLFAGSPSAILQVWRKPQMQEEKIADAIKPLEPEVKAGLRALLEAVIYNDLPLDEPLRVFSEVVQKFRAKKRKVQEFDEYYKALRS